MIWSDSSAMSRTSVAIATTLVEFQEAQVWFIFAVQIASILAIVVNSQEGAFWGEIIVNAAVAYHISQNGILPMFLIQICLHNEGIRNWHTFLGFLLEYLLAIIAATQTIKRHDAFELFRSQSDLPACGGIPARGRTAPRLGRWTGRRSASSRILSCIRWSSWSWTASPSWSSLSTSYPGRCGSTSRPNTSDSTATTPAEGRWASTSIRRPSLRYGWRTFEVVYLVINILYLVSLIMVINAESFAANSWSYGQIIAVTV